MEMLYLCLAAVAVVGLIEWLKNFLKEFLAIPGWAWSLVVLAAEEMLDSKYGRQVVHRARLNAEIMKTGEW